MSNVQFREFGKIARLYRDIVITEKIDGTNAQVYISPDREDIVAGSRTRWITPENDNFGFASWVLYHKKELLTLGPGHHYGEWWGCGIQRGYGQWQRQFNLFNTSRWGTTRPACCGVVPVLYEGAFSDREIQQTLAVLMDGGSKIMPGYMNPEGIVIYHTASNQYYKVTLENDELPKGQIFKPKVEYAVL